MAKRKLKSYSELSTFSNTFQPTILEIKEAPFYLKGNWHTEYFKNDNPIVLELGCGKGEYTVEQAIVYPNKNFIGIDIKGARIWRGAKTAIDNKINNLAFVRTRVEFIEHFFEKEEIDEIWITFPDPQPKDAKENSRLTAPMFLNRYRNILKSEGKINLKTDNKFFYDYSLETVTNLNHPILIATDDLYSTYLPTLKDEKELKRLSIKTFYEEKFSKLGFKINYLQFNLKDA